MLRLINTLTISYLVAVIVSTYAKVEYNIVETSSGLVRGRLDQYKSTKYYSYKGIPYAESPTGSLRFQPPVPKQPWTGVYNATQYGPVCPQSVWRYKREQMSEDCLVLNIFVPVTNNSDKLLPVVVNIHGGGFRTLSGDSQYIYGPELLLQKLVIFISVNFRLGPHGFLSMNSETATGNAGLKDVILSLKWICKNIDKFNGDKNKITLMGHSSGASLIHYLMLTKKTTNLFQQVILISGSALNQRVLSRYPTEIALQLAHELDLWTRIHKLRRESRELYFYEFEFDGALNWAKLMYDIQKPGVSHADELGYLFLTNITKNIIDSIDGRTRKILNTMLEFITNFVKYGNPTPPHTNSNTTWPEYGMDQNYLVINDELKVMQRNASERYKRMCFWDQVYEEYYKYVRDGGMLQRKIAP
ncbi:venom carboxylesterase-6-like isoform X3 [Leptidea sinapis]|uniref:venom carboxylesterase-6-like isoform X3 n=1 Tax=Leptidea sinapis TaxID=189913 RepID=UPI0021C32591|nr:venom carboxylesterase-6-like isoform X3 [Leptidea sinapis]